MRFILLGLAAAVLGDRNKGGVSCGPQDLEEGEVVVGCVKRYECELPDGAWHLCPNEVKMAHPLVHCRLAQATSGGLHAALPSGSFHIQKRSPLFNS